MDTLYRELALERSIERTEPKDPRVEAALRDYLEGVDRGEAVDRETFLSRHAEIADELRSFIAAEDEVRKLAKAENPLDRLHDSTKSLSTHGLETVVPQLMAKRDVESGGTELTGPFGRYRILRALGKGAMGTVYLAEDTQIERSVAIKIPHFEDDPTGELLARFHREASAAGNLRHPNICPIHDVGQIDGKHYLSMAYIEGRPLSAFIQTDKPQTERQILILIRKLALGLRAAHDKGIVHRDLKPANIMVDTNSEPIIMDFGLAQRVRRNEDVRLTQTGNILGTPAFMSPEQCEGDPAKISSPTDQYSLGVILYELLTGQLPFRGSTIAVMGQILTKEPTPPRQLRTELDPRIEALCLKMMAKRPSERFASMKAVADELATILKSPAAKAASKVQPAPARRTPAAAQSLANQTPALHVQEEFAGNGEGGAARIGAFRRITQSWNKGAWNKGGWIPPKLVAFGLAASAVMACVIVIYMHKTAIVIDTQDQDQDPNVVVSVNGTKVEITGSRTKVVQGPPSAPGSKTTGPPIATFKNSLGMEFVLVPKGRSWLGGGGGKPGDKEVLLAQDFYLGKYEVTQEEWQQATGLTPSGFSRTGGHKDMVKDIPDEALKRFPVERVSWDDAQLLLDRLNKREKDAAWVYRLPNEVEWEYACRGGPLSDKSESAYDYYFDQPTNQLLPAQANFAKGLKRPCKVGSYQPNRLGLYDMHGNVWEWCDDAEKTADGVPHRVARGGSWVSRPAHCRAAYRDVYPLSLRDAKVGLRVARVPAGKEFATIPPEEKKPADVVPGTPAVRPQPSVATTAPKISGRPFLIRGPWSIENDELVQPKLAAGHEHPLIVFGEPALSHYDLTLEAKETGGNEALGIFFHWLGPRHYRKFFLAANRELNFSYSYDGKWSREDARKRLSYSSNQWYSLKLEVRGDTFRAYLDGVLQFEQIDERFTHGRICLFTNDTAARFRRIKVTDPQGKVLFEGLPELPNVSNKKRL